MRDSDEKNVRVRAGGGAAAKRVMRRNFGQQPTQSMKVQQDTKEHTKPFVRRRVGNGR